jgi:hypothetical protein
VWTEIPQMSGAILDIWMSMLDSVGLLVFDCIKAKTMTRRITCIAVYSQLPHKS